MRKNKMKQKENIYTLKEINILNQIEINYIALQLMKILNQIFLKI